MVEVIQKTLLLAISFLMSAFLFGFRLAFFYLKEVRKKIVYPFTGPSYNSGTPLSGDTLHGFLLLRPFSYLSFVLSFSILGWKGKSLETVSRIKF